MSRAPSIVLALREHNFHVAARTLEAATDAHAEILALRLALATIDGATHMLRIHARALRNTGAAHERGRLRSLEETIVARLGNLLLRVAHSVHQEVT